MEAEWCGARKGRRAESAPFASWPATDWIIETSRSELAEHREALERVGRDRSDRRHHAERNRQVVMGALLGKVGGREVHGDALRREREAGGNQRRAHPFSGFRHLLVGQADDREDDVAGRKLHLHVHGTRLDAFESDRRNARDHADEPPPEYNSSVAVAREQAGNDRWMEPVRNLLIERRFGEQNRRFPV
jgi:hypothetical protein